MAARVVLSVLVTLSYAWSLHLTLVAEHQTRLALYATQSVVALTCLYLVFLYTSLWRGDGDAVMWPASFYAVFVSYTVMLDRSIGVSLAAACLSVATVDAYILAPSLFVILALILSRFSGDRDDTEPVQ